MNRLAVLSMDVEDWYHTGYLRPEDCDQSIPRLEGLDLFTSILEQNAIPGQYFVLADLLERWPEKFEQLAVKGHDIASHGRSHVPPTASSLAEFKQEIEFCVRTHKRILGHDLEGFRACRFMLDRPRLDILRDAGIRYDSSLIFRRQHNGFDLSTFREVSPHILCDGDFFEFRLPSFPMGGSNWPIAGGGAIRILPWWMTAWPLSRRLQSDDMELYSFYIHPIDMSTAAPPPLPKTVSTMQRRRMQMGRFSTGAKLERLIQLLKASGFQFTTYSRLRQQLTSHQNQLPRSG